MSVADKMIMSDETAKGLVNGIKVGGFWGRFGVYLLMIIPMYLIFVVISFSQKTGVLVDGFTGIQIVDSFIFILLFLSPAILSELSVRSWRRKNGFSVYKNIEEELRQREVDIVVAREEKARGKLNTSSDGKDLDYWFGMMEKGAITEEEYEKKKIELL